MLRTSESGHYGPILTFASPLAGALITALAVARRPQHDCLARTPRRHRRPQTAGNPGVPDDQGSARIRCRAAGTGLTRGQACLSHSRRHSDHAARRGQKDGIAMRKRALLFALAVIGLCGGIANASGGESQIRVGNIDAFLTTPPDVERPPVALLIAGSGSTDHDGNGPQAKPATLKKLAEQLAARKIATLRYDKRGAGGWKPEFGKPEDFRFKDYVNDAVSLVNYLRNSGKFSHVTVVGHSEGGLVAILAARQVQVDRLVLLVTAARRQGDLLKAQLEKRQIAPDILDPIVRAIDSIMAGQTVDPPPRGFDVPPSMQPSLASAFVIDPIEPL